MKSSELKGFLTGLLIGDGCIDKGVTKRAFSIKSVDKNFIDLIESELKSCTPFNTQVRHIPAHHSCGSNHKEAWELRVKAHPYFNKIYHKFYNDYRHRVITKYVPKYITPYGIAMWYMSDGYMCWVGKTKGCVVNRRMELATDRYTENEVLNLVRMLRYKFGIACNMVRRGKSRRIRVLKAGHERFIDLIYPYIIPSMCYKIDLGYAFKPKWMSQQSWEKQCLIKSAIALTGKAEGKDIV